MYQFSEYQQQIHFNQQFDYLCESIAKSGISFDQYWQTYAPQALVKMQNCETPEQVLVEFGLWQKLKGLFGGGGGGQQQAAPQQSAEDLRIVKFRAGFAGHVAKIKKMFAMSMRNFMKQVQDYAASVQDPHILGLGKIFYQRIMNAVQPQVDQFSHENLPVRIQPKDSPVGYKDEFNRMMSGRRQQKMDALRQRAQELRGQQVKRLTGLDPNDPGIQAARQKIQAGGYDPFDTANYKDKEQSGPTTAGAPVAKQLEPAKQKKEQRKEQHKECVDLMESLIRQTGRYTSWGW
jgi:hypothetical protein